MTARKNHKFCAILIRVWVCASPAGQSLRPHDLPLAFTGHRDAPRRPFPDKIPGTSKPLILITARSCPTKDHFRDSYGPYRGSRHPRRRQGPFVRSAIGRTGILTDKPMNRGDAWRMIQRRAAELGLRVRIGCHTFRATGITAYLEAGGTWENAQDMAAHESPRTTRLYDRTGDEITLDEVERIAI